MRICEGMAAYPQGALCAGPEWKPLWNLSTLGTSIESALAGADTAKAHFVTVAKNGHTALVCWSLQTHRPLLIAWVSGGTNADLDSSGSVVITATNNATYRDKSPTARWFASPIADRIILGNGVDANLVWASGALAVMGPAATPADPNTLSRVRIPPCTCFRQHVNRSIFAAGNASLPMRVWITDAPNAGETFVDGIRSAATGFIDVHAHKGAARITALSVFQQYVTVHTDKAPVNLFGVDRTSDGWRCQQDASAANASAINPDCVGDINGDADFYLGGDLEVYFDQAIRSGPFEKRTARSQECATVQGAGLWNKQAAKPVQSSGYHCLYDRESRLFWMWMPNAFDGRAALWCFNERTRAVVGPWRYPDASAVGIVRSLGASTVTVITAAGECLYARLDLIGEVQPEGLEAEGTALGADYAVLTSAPTAAPGVPYVAVTAGNDVFAEVAGSSAVGITGPLKAMQAITPGDHAFTQFFKNAYLARLEFPWQDLGSSTQFKNFLEVRLSIERDARAYVGIWGETDAGRTGGRWRGIVHGKDKVRIPLNLFGNKVRIRIVAIVFNAGRFLVRNVEVGYSVAGAD